MRTILYLTDLYYEANGRKYHEEDLYLTSRLKEHFNLLLGHPQQAIEMVNKADLIVFRNTGPVIMYQDYFQKFVQVVNENNYLTFNSFDGKADIRGKEYLIDLTKLGYPVIPTFENPEPLTKFDATGKFVVKLKNGADSIGMEILSEQELLQANLTGKLVQPFIEFKYEVSFYYINNQLQYAFYAPDKDRRWDLRMYEPTKEDIAFANKFIEWNNITHGITRVDACRLKDESLLLVELEDLNPFLSLDLLEEEKRQDFIKNFVVALKDVLN